MGFDSEEAKKTLEYVSGDVIVAKAVLEMMKKAQASQAKRVTAADRLRKRSSNVDATRFGLADKPTDMKAVRAQAVDGEKAARARKRFEKKD